MTLFRMSRTSFCLLFFYLVLLSINCAKSQRPGNMALGKNTIQSSTWQNPAYSAASHAVDGNKDPYYYDSSCSHTDAVAPSWWAVDLGLTVQVDHVTITNRYDCCAARLQNFTIGITNVSPWTSSPVLSPSTTCNYSTAYPPAGTPTDILCNPYSQPGRYLFVYIPRAEYLTICELEVYTL